MNSHIIFEISNIKLAIVTNEQAIIGIYPNTHKYFAQIVSQNVSQNNVSRETILQQLAIEQLQQYFANQREVFELPLAHDGTEFQQKIWQHLREIPYGKTQSYAEVARAIGKPKASRAVGSAIGKNPISIVIPCHRVIGSNGELAGYAGGIEMKQWLLNLEQ